MMPAKYMLYADFESILADKIDNDDDDDKEVDTTIGIAEGSPAKGETHACYQEHRGVSWYTKLATGLENFTLEGFQFPQTDPCVGTDAHEKFLDYVQKLSDKIYKEKILEPKPLEMTDEE